MPLKSLLDCRRHRRKLPPIRFVPAFSPPLPHLEEHHTSQQVLSQQISVNSQSDIDDENGTDPEEFDEVMTLSLSELRNYVQCPICLGIIKNTRTVMRCLHRFCKECIDKSLRLGNKECPVCRIHCASRRSLRDDINFDNLITSIYVDVEKYENKELILHEEERARNEQIQTSIAQISKRQSKALIKVQNKGNDIASSTSRVPSHCRNSYSSRETNQNIKSNDSNKNQDENVVDRNSLIKRRNIFPIHAPLVVVDVEDGEGIQCALEPTNENIGSSFRPGNRNLFSWGKSCSRSRSKTTRINRIEKLTDHLASMEKIDHERDSIVKTNMEGDKILWMKDHTISGLEPSSSMDFLQTPPEVIKKLDEECTFIVLAQRMNSIL